MIFFKSDIIIFTMLLFMTLDFAYAPSITSKCSIKFWYGIQIYYLLGTLKVSISYYLRLVRSVPSRYKAIIIFSEILQSFNRFSHVFKIGNVRKINSILIT